MTVGIASAETQTQTEPKSAAVRSGADAGALLTIPPAVGYRFGAGRLRYTLALSWSVQFGPLLRLDSADGLRSYRFLLEPGLNISRGPVEVAYFLRWGLRRIWHGAGIWGVGLGCGVTHSLSRTVDASFSPEALVTFGRCCTPGMAIAWIRYEYSVLGDSEVWTGLSLALW